MSVKAANVILNKKNNADKIITF